MTLTFKKSLTIILVSLALTLSTIGITPANAAGPWYVAPGGDDGNSCSSTASPCATINGAIGKASPDDTIYVAIGTYTSSTGTEVVLINKSITLSGGWDASFATQNGTSTIDGENTRNGIRANTPSGSTINISRFVIQNSDYTGIYINGNGIIAQISQTTVQMNRIGITNGGGTLSFSRTAIINNTENGIYNSGNVTFTNSTISGNHSQGIAGSAISNVNGNINIQYSTITNNTGGHAIYSQNGGAQIEIGNSILAGNSYRDCLANITSDGYNIFGFSPPCTNYFTLQPSDQVGINPQLAVLFPGGYHPLLFGSPAIDAANLATCPATDQRGVTRPEGIACDIGAYEGHLAGVASVMRANPNPTRTSTVDFIVTFSQAVTGVDTISPFSDFALTTTGVTGASITSVSGSGATYNVTINTGTDTGTIRLDVIDDDTILDAASNPLAGSGAGNGNFTTGEAYIIDRTGPTVLSSLRVNSNPTYASSVDFTVTFSESVSGVDASDFTLTTTGSVSGASVSSVSGSGDTYNVTIHTTGSRPGTIRLDVIDDDTIIDSVSNPLGNTGLGNGNFTTGEIYNFNFYVYLPLIRAPRSGIHGHVFFNGSPVAILYLELRFYNGASWSTIATTTTSADGSYEFTDIPSLAPGQIYYVLYRDYYNDISGALWLWGTRELTSYLAGSSVEIGNFDIADVVLVSPANGATVALPYTFQWTPRPATPSDTYEFDLDDPVDGDPSFYTAPPLGYVGAYTLKGLPAGFRRNVQYGWEIWIYSPDGGFGISYEARGVRFSNTGTGFSIAAPQSVSPKHTSAMDDLPPRK